MFDRDLGTAAIPPAAQPPGPAARCRVPRGKTAQTRGYSPGLRRYLRRAISKPPPALARVSLLTGQPVMTGHDHAPPTPGLAAATTQSSCTLAGIPGSGPAGRAARPRVPAHRTSLVHRRRAGHPGQPKIEQE